MIRNRATPAGAALGRELARLVDEAEPRARLVEPLIPPRCASCAFRAGPHTPNGSEATLGDALKCVLENVPFGCHEPARAGEPCSGWAMLRLAHPSAPGSCPWPFSDEVGADQSEPGGDPRNTDALAGGEGRHDPTFGPDRTGQGVCVTHTPGLRSKHRIAEGLPTAQAPLCAKRVGFSDILSRPEGVQRTLSGGATTEPAPEYARRDAPAPEQGSVSP